MAPYNKNKSEGQVTPKSKRKFVKKWLQEPLFQGWLMEDLNNPDKAAYCHCCKINMSCHSKRILKVHATSKAHLFSIERAKKAKTLLEPNNYINELKEAELRIAMSMVENNIAFHSLEKFLELDPAIVSKPNIVQGLKISSTKCTALIKNVLHEVELENVMKILKNRKFSISVDESTEVGSKKLLCVTVQYFSDQGQVQNHLLHLIELCNSLCTAENIFQEFKNFFDVYQIPFTNITSLSTDSSSVVVKENNGFYALLQNINPSVILVKRICYSDAIVSEKNCLELPKNAIFEALEILSPQYVLNTKLHESCQKIVDLADLFKFEEVDINNLKKEWEIFLNSSDEFLTFLKLDNKGIEEFWFHFINQKTENGNLLYPNLAFIIQAALSIPHSNAEAHRVFSMVNEVRTQRRNNIDTPLLNAICFLRSWNSIQNVNATNFKVSEMHYRLFKSQMYENNKQ